MTLLLMTLVLPVLCAAQAPLQVEVSDPASTGAPPGDMQCSEPELTKATTACLEQAKQDLEKGYDGLAGVLELCPKASSVYFMQAVVADWGRHCDLALALLQKFLKHPHTPRDRLEVGEGLRREIESKVSGTPSACKQGLDWGTPDAPHWPQAPLPAPDHMPEPPPRGPSPPGPEVVVTDVPRPTPSWTQTLYSAAPYVAIGGGVVTVIGLLAMLHAHNLRSDSDRLCANGLCQEAARSDVDSGRTAALVGRTLFFVGLPVAIVSTVVWLGVDSGPDQQEEMSHAKVYMAPVPGGGTVGVHGLF